METGNYFDLNEAHRALKPRKKYRSAFLGNLFSALESQKYSELLRWSVDGDYVELHHPQKIAQNVFPEIYKHSNLSSFTRQLNMYEFQRVRTLDKTCLVYFHPLFRRSRPDLMVKITRLPVGAKKNSIVTDEAEIYESSEMTELESSETRKKAKTSEYTESKVAPAFVNSVNENSAHQPNDIRFAPASNSENHENPENFGNYQNYSPESIGSDQTCSSFVENNDNRISEFSSNFQLLVQIASNSRGFIEGSNLPDGFQEFRRLLEKMLGFEKLEKLDTKRFDFCN